MVNTNVNAFKIGIVQYSPLAAATRARHLASAREMVMCSPAGQTGGFPPGTLVSSLIDDHR